MTKAMTKLALAAAVVSLAMAGSTTASLAKKHTKMKKPAACAAWTYKTANCTGAVCSMNRCGLDGKWYPSLLLCWQPACPK